jgi:hypothetical protein
MIQSSIAMANIKNDLLLLAGIFSWLGAALSVGELITGQVNAGILFAVQIGIGFALVLWALRRERKQEKEQANLA